MTSVASLIINSPYVAPARHWQQGRDGSLALLESRRPASYEIFDIRNNTRRTAELERIGEIRGRVDAWRAAAYPGATAVTRRLLEHWHDRNARRLPFYFCQLEAIETLIWWVEGTPEFRQGIFVPGDGGPWERLCSKMATGAGKTAVMAMIVTWQVLNALTYPKRQKDFSRAFFVVAPGLTVKERLRVLYPGEPDNAYDEFSLCPSEALRQKLNQAEILIENWHTLMPLKEADRSVVKKGAESDEAFTRRVLGKLAIHRDLVVINDEAHHAYRVPAEAKISKKAAAEQGLDLDEATRWIEGLDRKSRAKIPNRTAPSVRPSLSGCRQSMPKAASDSGAGMWLLSRHRFRTFWLATEVAGPRAGAGALCVPVIPLSVAQGRYPPGCGQATAIQSRRTSRAAFTPLRTAPSIVAG